MALKHLPCVCVGLSLSVKLLTVTPSYQATRWAPNPHLPPWFRGEAFACPALLPPVQFSPPDEQSAFATGGVVQPAGVQSQPDGHCSRHWPWVALSRKHLCPVSEQQPAATQSSELLAHSVFTHASFPRAGAPNRSQDQLLLALLLPAAAVQSKPHCAQDSFWLKHAIPTSAQHLDSAQFSDTSAHLGPAARLPSA